MPMFNVDRVCIVSVAHTFSTSICIVGLVGTSFLSGNHVFLEKRRGHQKKQAKDSSQHLRHMSFRHGIDGEGGMYNPHLMFPKEDVQSPPKQPPKQPPKLADVFNRHFLYERPNDIYQIESAQKVRERCSQHDQSRSSSGYHFDGEEE